MDNIFTDHGHRISQWNDDVLNPHLLQEYADVIHAKGAPLENCFGFIDGTVRPIARPDQQQRIVYNGHKRVHSLKFQSVALPNGLIGNMYGPVGKLVIYNRRPVSSVGRVPDYRAGGRGFEPRPDHHSGSLK